MKYSIAEVAKPDKTRWGLSNPCPRAYTTAPETPLKMITIYDIMHYLVMLKGD
jgi:hypothetical protein